MDLLVVAPGDLPAERTFELAERHGREARRIVALASVRIGEGRSGIKMHPPHRRADQALYVAAVMGSAYRSKDQLDALFPACPRECAAAEIGAVVRMHGLGQSGRRPRRIDLALLQPRALVVNRVQHAQAQRNAGRLVHGQMKPDDHARETRRWRASAMVSCPSSSLSFH